MLQLLQQPLCEPAQMRMLLLSNSPNLEETIEHLKGIGADEVILDTNIKTDLRAATQACGDKARLALNCVGGRSSADTAKALK